MDLPANYIEKFKPASQLKTNQPRSSRDELLDRFLDRLNPSRIADGYKPYSASHVAGILSRAGVTTEGMFLFYQRCDSGQSSTLS
jgi:hypothetical protein